MEARPPGFHSALVNLNMSKLKELKKAAEDLGIAVPKRATVAKLEKLISEAGAPGAPDEPQANQLGTPDDKPVINPDLEMEGVTKTKSGIEVGDPRKLRPVELPLVVKLPKDASEAQIEYAKILNAYAYTNPDKWDKKKGKLIERLESLKGAKLNIPEGSSLSLNKSKLSFSFVNVGGGKEVLAQSAPPKSKGGN